MDAAIVSTIIRAKVARIANEKTIINKKSDGDPNFQCKQQFYEVSNNKNHSKRTRAAAIQIRKMKDGDYVVGGGRRTAGVRKKLFAGFLKTCGRKCQCTPVDSKGGVLPHYFENMTECFHSSARSEVRPELDEGGRGNKMNFSLRDTTRNRLEGIMKVNLWRAQTLHVLSFVYNADQGAVFVVVGCQERAKPGRVGANRTIRPDVIFTIVTGGIIVY